MGCGLIAKKISLFVLLLNPHIGITVVHRYESVDVEILTDVVNNRLSDFEMFRNEVLKYEKSQFEALKGVRVLCDDEVLCAEFASLVAREYEDEMAQCYRALHAA